MFLKSGVLLLYCETAQRKSMNNEQRDSFFNKDLVIIQYHQRY